MSTASAGLKHLHQLHIQLRTVQEKLERGPKQIQARRQFTERKQAELAARKEHLTNMKKSADSAGLQLRSNESKIADLRAKLNAASSNREFDIIKAQIEADTMANSVLEDEILEALEKVDETQQAVKGLEGEVAAAQQEEQRIAAEVAAAEPGLKQDAARLEESLRAAERELPGEVAQVYKRLVLAHGANALAPVENGVCGACHVGLAPQSRVDVNTGKILFCRSCGRLLYPAE
jgi:uncharacterized protein